MFWNELLCYAVVFGLHVWIIMWKQDWFWMIFGYTVYANNACFYEGYLTSQI